MALPRPYFQHSTDRKSTRLNSSHLGISYAVFCLKKKSAPQVGPRRPGQSHRLVGEPGGRTRHITQEDFPDFVPCAMNGRHEVFFFKVPAPPDFYFLSLRVPLLV